MATSRVAASWIEYDVAGCTPMRKWQGSVARKMRIDPMVPAWLGLSAAIWGARGFLDGLGRDSALYVYAGQAVADGAPPYVMVMNRAGPLAHLLPGIGVGLGRATGLGDVVGARVVFFVLAVLSPALVYLLVRTAFHSRVAACAAAAVILGFAPLARLATAGPESKVPMVVLLSAALLLALQRRMLLAGVVTGLATLTWQPVMFVAAAAALVMALTAPGDGWRPRLREAARYVLGGLATLVAAVGYFLAVGALQPFLDGFWRANAGYTRQTGLLDRPGTVVALLGNWHVWPLLVGCGVSLLLAAWSFRARLPRGADAEWRNRALALGAATAAGIGWCLRAFDWLPDAMLVLPTAAAGIGSAVAVMVTLAARSAWARRILIGAVIVSLLATCGDTLRLSLSGRETTLETQRNSARAVFDALPAAATAMSIEAPQPLVLAGRRSISRYQIFGHGIPGWLESEWPGGAAGYAAWLRGSSPTVLFIGAGGTRPFLLPFRADYVSVGGSGYGWRVLVHRDVALAVRRELVEAVAGAPRGTEEPAAARATAVTGRR